MQEYELKYGCNPNQKPSRIYMQNGETADQSIMWSCQDISIFLMHLTAGSW